jgi:Uma2 family endonuclease
MAVTTNPVTEASPPDRVKSPAEQIPPLENGDRLTRPEFERRYEAMPGLKKAELIEGVVYVPYPVNFDKHGGPHFDLIIWLGQYRLATSGVRGGDNSSLRLDLDNEPQPDVFLIVLPSHGGQAQIDADGYLVGAPELVVEVASSSASYDLHDKLDVYRRNGAREYLVWRVIDQAIDWFVLRDGRFQPLALDEAGLYKSEILPGLWLDPAALLRGDLAAVIQILQQGLASPEHAAFVARLQQAGTGESASL